MSSPSSSGGGFAFDTPQAVMHVLASVRKSDIAPKDKNSLRDLVLSYTNGGKDPSLKIQIEKQLSSLAVQPLPRVDSAATGSQPGTPLVFGSSRSVPGGFTASAPAPQAAPPIDPVPTPESVPTQQPVTAPVPQPEPAPSATPTPQSAVAPVSASQSAPVAATPAPQPVPTTPTPVTTPAPSADNSAALARVREIKGIVNEKIGNPVNLVDIDNKVGREYMSALLDAMKKLSSGVNSASTMERLEAAFVEVQRVLEQPRPVADVSATPPPPPVAPVPAPQTQPEVPTEPVMPPTPTPQPPVTPEPKPTQPEPEPATPPPVVDAPVAPTPKPEPVAPTEPPTPPVAPVAPTPKPATNSEPKPESKSSAVDENTPRPQSASTPIEDKRWSAASAVIKPAPMKPLSESAEPLKSVDDVPTQDSITNKDADPLRSQEVNEGLNQLLSDWALFKKSGLFGTGPSGVEHPLYKKIMDLQIPLLLAGRFEGATQEIKQSITDYMNGWRYEQGIIYEQGETFDHYLRRVIRHILDLQK